MKKILNYAIIFITTLLILFSALAVSSKIPKAAIEENIKESVEFYRKRAGIYRIKNKHIYSYIHYYADTRKLNIIYCLDSNKPIESMLWSNYYQVTKKDVNKDFIDLVKESKEPNTQYLRYWNGCMLFLRPLLVIFNMEQIYLLNIALMSILAIILIIQLFKKSKKIAFIFIFSILLVSIWYVPLCIEYSVTFYIMIITLMIAIKIDDLNNDKPEKEREDKLLKLFLITGIVTTFFDFLTTEILTILVPLMFILMIRKEEKRSKSIKETGIFLLKACFLWLVGYCGMWLAKWILASIILNINAFEYVKDNFFLRINGLQGLNSHEELYGNVLKRNIFTIPLMEIISIYFFKVETKISLFLIILWILTFINWKELKNKKYLLYIIAIGFMPYVRYLILANHSYRHVMFTFRDQIITIMCLSYTLIESFNYELMSKKVERPKLLKKKNLKDKKIKEKVK